MAAPDNGSGPYYMSAVAEQYQLLAASQQQNALQYKRCNCKKAKCLKLYCVCFAAGVYCQNCNCLECSNLPEKSELVMAERQRVLQREPMAFTTKVMGPAHLRGCKCKRSRCVKKYCDCYDAQVRCSEMCKCKDCQNQPDNFNGAAAAAAAAAAAGAPSMNLALGPQHHAMLLAMQQQQQGAECDPAALARLQLFGGAGFPAEGLEAAASGGGGGSQPPSRAASPGLAAFLPAASQAFAAGAAAAELQCPVVPGLPHSAAAAAAAALQAAAGQQDITLPQAPPLMHSQPQAYQLGNFGAVQDPTGHWQQMLLDHRQQQQHSVEGWEQAADVQGMEQHDVAADTKQQGGGGTEVERAREQGAAGVPPAAGEGVRVSGQASDPGAAAGHLQLVVPAHTRRGSSAPALHDDSPSAAAAAAAPAAAAAAAAAAAGGGGTHRSASVGAEPPRMQERNAGTRASSLPPPDALPVTGLRPVRRSLQQQQQSVSGQGLASALQSAELQSAAASTYAAEAAELALAPAAAAAAAAAGAAGFYAPYRITKVEPLLYTGGHPAGLAASGGVDDVAVDSQQQQQQYAQEQEAAPANMDLAAGSMRQHDSGLLYEEGQEGAAADPQRAADAAAAAAAGEDPAGASAAAAAAAAAAVCRDEQLDHHEGRFQSSTAAMAAAHDPEAAAAAAAAALAGTAHEDAADSAAAVAALGLPGMLDDPTAAGVLAAKLGLCDNVQQAAVNAAKFLRDILNLSQLAAGPDQPTGSFTGSKQQPQLEELAPGENQQQPGSGTTTPHGGRHPATPAFSTGGVSATHDMHQPQPGSRLRHSSSAAHAAASRPAGSLLASASLGHWGTAHTPASKAAGQAAAAAGGGAGGGPLGSGMSPAVSAGSDMHLQLRQQHVVASTPQCGPPGGHAGGGVGAGTAAAAGQGAGQGTGVTSAGSVSFAKSLGGGMYAPGAGGITPLPLAAVHAPGVRVNSCLRGPSPLGPVGGAHRDASHHSLARETGGLQALMGPAARERQQHAQAAADEQTPSAAGSGGAPCSAARRSSMQLLPGSFRLAAGHNNSPGVGSPAIAAALAHSGALAGGAADSPAGSVSLAPSIASAAPASAGGHHPGAAAELQEQTPVYSNAQKQPCGLYELDQHQQQQQLDTDMHMDGVQEGLMHDVGEPLLMCASSRLGDHTTPVPASSAAALAAAAGAAALAAAAAGPVHTPLSAALEALGAAVSAPTPAAQQQLQAAAAAANLHGDAAGRAAGVADGCDAAAAGVTNLFGGVPGGATNLQDMTPSSLFIASLLAANRTPTDMFLTSPLPPIGSALRQAGLGSAGPLSAMHPSTAAQAAGAGGVPARGVLAHGVDCAAGVVVGAGMALRGGQVTPLLLHGLQHGAPGAGGHRQATPGSADLGAAAARGAMVQRHGRGGGLGVGALCTGILRGAAAEAASSAEAAAAWAREQQQLEAAAAGSGLDAAAGVLGGEAPGEQQEDATASGVKPDTDKAAARAAAAAAGGATSPATAAAVGSLLAAASYISTPRDAGVSRGRPLSGEEAAAAEAPGAKRQRLNSGGTPGRQQPGGGCGGWAGGSLEQQQQQPSPALFKPVPGSAAAAPAACAKVHPEQDTRHEIDAAGCDEPAAGAGCAAAQAGIMHPPRQQQQQQTDRQHAGAPGHMAHSRQGALSALQQLLQGPAAPAGAAGDDALQPGMGAEWQQQQQAQDLATAAAAAAAGVKEEPGAGGQVPGLLQQQLGQSAAEQQQLGQSAAEQQQLGQSAAEQQQQEMMQSPPVPTQRRDIQGQGAGRDRSPSMESYAAADAMLALCVIKRFGQASAQQ